MARTPEPCDLHPLAAVAQRVEPASTGAAHVGASHLRFEIENEKATPTLSSLERLARALEVTVPDLLSGGERTRQEEVREFMQDEFLAELMPFVSQLNGCRCRAC